MSPRMRPSDVSKMLGHGIGPDEGRRSFGRLATSAYLAGIAIPAPAVNHGERQCAC
jgi:hypothetical protein